LFRLSNNHFSRFSAYFLDAETATSILKANGVDSKICGTTCLNQENSTSNPVHNTNAPTKKCIQVKELPASPEKYPGSLQHLKDLLNAPLTTPL
jgi:hypothetical protein